MIEDKNDSELISVEGTVEQLIYQNEENGYCICRISSDIEDITLVGFMPFIAAGETIRAMGNWTLNHKFGRQFKVEYYERLLPDTESGIMKYLSSCAIKGIGPSTALKIVEKFGKNSLDVIESDPESLATVSGISIKKAYAISEHFKEKVGIRDVIDYCKDLFTPSIANKIYNKWGSATIDMIQKNPYALCDEAFGISFEAADRIAFDHGFEADSELRIKSGIKALLKQNAIQKGHVFLPCTRLAESVSTTFEISNEKVESALKSLLDEEEICISKVNGKICIYLPGYYSAERYVSNKLKCIDEECPSMEIEDIDILISSIEKRENIEYAPMQKKAIAEALSNGVMVLTGGPGTGKTTVIKALIKIFEMIETDVALAAPTGRAAKRMTEATGYEAKTIHRLLEVEYSDNEIVKFKRGEDCCIDESVIIVDEASMIDITLMESLLRAVRKNGKVILIGDSDQLPSVGAGNVLNDIIKSEVFSVIRLKKIFRQAEESLIVTNAHLINEGEYPDLESKTGDFFFIPKNSDAEIVSTIKALYSSRLPKRFGESIKNQIQVIAPSRKGESGTYALNAELQSILNPGSKNKTEMKLKGVVFREGDKIMQIRNNYDIIWESENKSGIGIFNGDIGTIENIDLDSETALIRFDDGRIAVYDLPMFDQIEHAYAITIHKSQGSEYPIMLIPIYSYSKQLMTRNLLYTAVTRARDMVIMVGKADVVRNMVDNNIEYKRYTSLKHMLRGEC